MIDILFEQHLVQNTGFAAEAIFQASLEVFNLSSKTRGIPLPLSLLVLPLVFHRRTANSLFSKQQPGAIYKALAENRELPIGLQSRMEVMAKLSLGAIALGASTGLLKIDHGNQFQVIPARASNVTSHVTEDVKIILAASKRVGQIFYELNLNQISELLQVVF